ncbi:hypothetical protein JL_4 [Bacillus phage JL]|uniref:Uncharacterized protein n=1 Tax=Bacillus phage JL TaxID=1296655 RepID=S5MSW7_9CAUD|nr:hypothetical protein AVV47_gp004 [Bacillus phage JL]AGR46887.1 hypothetical protein JL_4 [Bacillus phage JL]
MTSHTLFLFVLGGITMSAINDIQKSINQIGMEGVVRYLPKGMKLHPCDLHGSFLAHYKDELPTCPLCIQHNHAAEGTTATEVEHYINIRDLVAPPHNPHS